ncbi:MAG: YciI family protein [Nitrospiraceae bacterium]
MKYLCLVYVEEHILHAMPQNERIAISDESMAYCATLQKQGQLIAASPLHPVDTATTVRVREGKTSTTDGPFAETKEQLGGFLMIDVPDLNDAIRIAAQFPAARFGSVEVRPMKELGCAD